MDIFPSRTVSIIVFAAYLALIAAGLWVAVTRDPVTAYIAFAWVNPLAAALWLRFEFELFCGANVNLPFVYTLLATSFLAGVVCLLPVTLVAWRTASALAWVGILAASLLHSVPFLLYAMLHISFHSARRSGRRTK